MQINTFKLNLQKNKIMKIDARRQFKEVEGMIETLCRRHNADRVFVLTDSVVASLTDEFMKGTPRLVVEPGEGSKSVDGAVKVWQFLVDEGALRRSVLINLGGGMISDLGGFAAATFKRGIGFVNVPTTLLAAVDAATGGKTGINFAGLKNEVGAFATPLGVFPLTALFPHLSRPEWLSGVGEAIKTGLLHSEELFELTVSDDFIVRRDQTVVDKVVKKCAEFKSAIVKEDFRESGKRKILNLGHTAGHAIESWKMAKGSPMPHGVAVAHGLLFTLERSCSEAGLSPIVVDRYRETLERNFPPLDMSDEDLQEAWKYMIHDKKNSVAGTPSWVLLEDIGKAVY